VDNTDDSKVWATTGSRASYTERPSQLITGASPLSPCPLTSDLELFRSLPVRNTVLCKAQRLSMVNWSVFNDEGTFSESESFCTSKLHKYTLEQVLFRSSRNTVLCKAQRLTGQSSMTRVHSVSLIPVAAVNCINTPLNRSCSASRGTLFYVKPRGWLTGRSSMTK